ncbi:MAG: methyltransferase domain-containing protein [Bacteroidota bacterium]
MPSLNERSYQAELIDDLNLSNDALRQNLEELATINKWLGGNEVTLSGLGKILVEASLSEKTLRIADIGCGGGDMLKLMANWLKKSPFKADFVGIDANQFMIDFAKKRTISQANISYIKEDAFSDKLKDLNLDIATMTLFCHHFTENQLIELFTNLRKSCRIGLIINDLHRHWFAYYSISWLTAIFSKSYLVKNDARLSVWRGFHQNELIDILQKAGFEKFTIQWRWAFRWEIVAWSTPFITNSEINETQK